MLISKHCVIWSTLVINSEHNQYLLIITAEIASGSAVTCEMECQVALCKNAQFGKCLTCTSNTFLCLYISGLWCSRNSQREVQHRGLLRQPDLTGAGVPQLRPIPALRRDLQEMTRSSTKGAELLDLTFTWWIGGTAWADWLSVRPLDIAQVSLFTYTSLTWSYVRNTHFQTQTLRDRTTNPRSPPVGCVRLRAVWVSTVRSSHHRKQSLNFNRWVSAPKRKDVCLSSVSATERMSRVHMCTIAVLFIKVFFCLFLLTCFLLWSQYWRYMCFAPFLIAYAAHTGKCDVLKHNVKAAVLGFARKFTRKVAEYECNPIKNIPQFFSMRPQMF